MLSFTLRFWCRVGSISGRTFEAIALAGMRVALGCGGGTIVVWAISLSGCAYSVNASPPLSVENAELHAPVSEALDVSPTLLEESPVLQRWLEDIPDVWADIADEPSLPTRVRWGYVRWMARETEGWGVGVEDVFLARSGLTLSGSYVRLGDADRSMGADLRYYLLPLGGSVNVAPIAGYRYLEANGESRQGLNVGVRVLVVLSRGGGSDLSISQTWIAPLSGESVSMTTLSVAHAIASHLRLSTDLQRLNGEGQIGIFMEWMP